MRRDLVDLTLDFGFVKLMLAIRVMTMLSLSGSQQATGMDLRSSAAKAASRCSTITWRKPRDRFRSCQYLFSTLGKWTCHSVVSGVDEVVDFGSIKKESANGIAVGEHVLRK